VEQLGSTFDSSKSNEKEKENLEVVNIPKKPIKASKWMEESKSFGGSRSSSSKIGPESEVVT
jgi:hypothetical protein